MSDANSKTSRRWRGSLALATMVLGGFMLFAGASNVKADDDFYRYDRQVRYTESRAREAEECFGYNSREAKHWRHENHEARERAEHYRKEYWKHRNRYERDRRDRDYHRNRGYYRDYDRQYDRNWDYDRNRY